MACRTDREALDLAVDSANEEPPPAVAASRLSSAVRVFLTCHALRTRSYRAYSLEHRDPS